MEYLKRIIDNAVKIVMGPEDFKTGWDKVRIRATLAGFVGLFLSVFLAFFVEYIKNASKAAGKT